VNERRRFVGQVAWVSLGRLGAALLQSLSLILAVRLVSPGEFGLLAGVLGLATVSQTAIDMGVATFISRERAANPQSGAIATALRFNALTSLTLTGVVVMALVLAGALIDGTYFLMIPLAFWVSAERNADARLSVVFADGDAKINVLNLLARRTLLVVLFASLAAAHVEAILAFSIASAIAALLSSLFANLYVRRRVTAAPSITYRELLRQSWPYWVHSLATQARNLDVVLLTLVSNAVQAGFYSSASRLTNPLTLLTSSLASVMLPSASRASASAQSIRPLIKVAVVVLAVMTVIYAAIFVAAPPLVPVILTPAYAPAIPVIQVVVAGLPFAAAASLLASLLQGLNYKHFVATTSTVVAVVCLTLIVIGSGLWGAFGAGMALSLSVLLQAAVLMIGLVVLHRGPRGAFNES
jgi:O-antigen/teichoic acid export membrane protein